MAAVYESSSADVATDSSDTSLVAAKPTGLVAGDVLVAVAFCLDSRTISPPSGWTVVADDSDASTGRLYVFSRVADAVDASATDFTFAVSSGFNTASVALTRISGATAAGIVTAFAVGTNSSEITCPNVTTPATDSLVLWGAAQSLDAGPATIARGTERQDVENSTAQAWIYLATEAGGPAGLKTGPVITKTGFGAARAFAVAVAPSGGGGGGDPLTAGTASFVSSGPAGISVSATAPTGGSGALSYQWERNADGGAYADVAGATGLSLTDSTATTVGVLYGYRLKQTRGSDTVTTNVVTSQVYSGGALTGGSRNIFGGSVIR